MRSGGNVRLFAATRTPCLTLRRCASRLCTDGAASQLYEQLRPAALQSRGQGPPTCEGLASLYVEDVQGYNRMHQRPAAEFCYRRPAERKRRAAPSPARGPGVRGRRRVAGAWLDRVLGHGRGREARGRLSHAAPPRKRTSARFRRGHGAPTAGCSSKDARRDWPVGEVAPRCRGVRQTWVAGRVPADPNAD